MDVTNFADTGLPETAPEFWNLFSRFAFDEVVHQGDLDDRTRSMDILAFLMGCQGAEAFRAMLPGALNSWLAANCFGDYYTRRGLDARQREMSTFCFLAAQGGREPQLTSHAAANMGIGNDRAFLIQLVSRCLPYIGYPSSLNALACIRQAAEQGKET